MSDEKEQVGGSGGCVDQQTEIARRGLNYGGRFAPAQPTMRNDDRFAEVEKVNGGFKK
jgi:hypothetical protein